MEFYICGICGQIIEKVKGTPVPVMCCGQKMNKIVPGAVDAAVEKHVPAVTVDGNKVTAVVGSVEHPMADVHYIEWIVLETAKGSQRANLKPGEAPKAEFVVADGDKAVAVYAYCNLHGLWKADL